ncbi:MAG: alpha-hydroxy acid oxidase [Pseudorhodoplanes sp.]|jgi:L-lactate dehydrogenase (cytochrome)|nr:alpha-hydroxy acid oxidase [Pseudorhodoplanes sp.]
MSPDAGKTASEPKSWGVAGHSRAARRKRNFPTVEDLRKRAERRVPRLGYATVAGGTGSDLCVIRNTTALDAIQIVPRYGVDRERVSTEVELFGRSYAAPVGVAPMGLQGVMWPGAERHLARAAQKSRIPYTAGTVGGVALEELAALAPDVIWFQLYRFPANDHAVGIDLVKRAKAAGAHVLVLTLDTPTRAKRPHELRNRLVLPFRPSARMVLETLMCPAWLAALLTQGRPSFPSLARYVGANPSKAEIADFAQNALTGGFTWDEVARYRDLWRGPMVVKGIMHPADAETAVSLGVDGVQVSNHGGRQFEAAPAAIDAVPSVAAAIGKRATVLFDGGVRSGIDIMRALAVGAHAALAGRTFLYGVAALGAEGADYVASLLIDELRIAMRQAGVHALQDIASLTVRHPGALQVWPAVAPLAQVGFGR